MALYHSRIIKPMMVELFIAVTLLSNSITSVANVSFYNNSAYNGGAMYQTHSVMFFRGDAVVMFTSNVVKGSKRALQERNYNQHGGPIYQSYSTMFFRKNAVVTFMTNKATGTHFGNGGALYQNYSTMFFKENAVVKFINNKAVGRHGGDGGAIYQDNSKIFFTMNTEVRFTGNVARKGGWYAFGGAVYSSRQSFISFNDLSRVSFNDNKADYAGGVLYVSWSSRVIFHGNSTVSLTNNSASSYGGAVYARQDSAVVFSENSTVNFTKNSATFGGAVDAVKSEIEFEGHSTVTFIVSRQLSNTFRYSTTASHLNNVETSGLAH